MAIDYFLTFHRFGSDVNEARVREVLLHEFPLTDHVDTGILTGPGLSVNVVVDDDDIVADGSNPPDLVLIPVAREYFAAMHASRARELCCGSSQ